MPSTIPFALPTIRLRIITAGLITLLVHPLAATLIAQVPGPGATVPSLEDDTAPLPDDPATVMAVVGQTPILWGDIQPKVDSRIAQVLEQQQVEFTAEQLAPARKNLARGALSQAIQTKMMSESFLLEQVGTQAAEKRREVSEMMHSRARQVFFDNELKGMKEKYGTEDLNELDAKLREAGSSLRARQREFADMMLGHMYMKSKIEKDPNVTLAEINAAYAKDIDSYRHNAKARWEQLSVLFVNHPSREKARELITAMAVDIYYNEGWKEKAKTKSEEPFAADGGQHDWTAQGSLASKPIDEQVFSIPLNKMSEIIEDDQGLHVIRVLERKPAGILPLADLQDDIRKKLKRQKIAESQAKMIEDMRKKVPVWSIYPTDLPGAKPLRPSSVATRPTTSTGPGSRR